MTTIAYRDGVLAADSRAYAGEKKPIGAKNKLRSLPDGTIYGISTNCVGGDAMVSRWVEAGCKPPTDDDLKPESFELLIVRPDGAVYFACNNLDLTGPLEAEFFSIGSGDHFALGAMAMGASAEEAVSIACDMDPWSARPVRTLRRQ